MFEAVLICRNTFFLAGLHEWTLSMKQQVWQVRVLRRNCHISKSKLLKSEQFWFVCLFLWLNTSYTTIFYSNGLGSEHILIFLCVLMVRRLPRATKLPFFVPSLYRWHVHCHFLEQRSHIWSNGGQIITQISYLCSSFITFLIPKGALGSKLLEMRALVSAGTSTAAVKERLPVAGLKARTPWEVICRTHEMQLLDLMAFHTVLVQAEITAQNRSQRRAGPATRCTWSVLEVGDDPGWPWCISNIWSNFCCR